MQKAVAELCLSHSNLVKWTAKANGIGNIYSLDNILKSKKKATHKGPLSQLKLLEDALLHLIFELHKQGIIINTFIDVLQESFLSPEFRTKIRLHIEWACTRCSACQPKPKAMPSSSWCSCTALSLARILTGILSSM